MRRRVREKTESHVTTLTKSSVPSRFTAPSERCPAESSAVSFPTCSQCHRGCRCAGGKGPKQPTQQKPAGGVSEGRLAALESAIAAEHEAARAARAELAAVRKQLSVLQEYILGSPPPAGRRAKTPSTGGGGGSSLAPK